MTTNNEEWATRMEEYTRRAKDIARRYPPVTIEEGMTDTYFDGSIGPMHRYRILDTSAYDTAMKRLNDEFKSKRKYGPAFDE